MALATVIPFPVPQSRPQPEAAGSIYAALADRLVTSLAGKPTVAVRISADGAVTTVAPECDFYPDAITAPGLACFCSGESDPVRIATRLQRAHGDVLAWERSFCEDGGESS